MRFFSKLKKGLTGHTGKTLAKLVVYAGVCLAVLLYLVSLIGNVHFFEKYTSYKAQLPDATGLLANDDVKLAGVAVGKVTGIHLRHGYADVSFQVKSDVKVRSTTRVGVRWRNLIGQKYLYLYPSKGGRVLKAGDRIGASHTVQTADVGDFLNAVGPVLQAIDPNKANAFVQALDQALSGNDARIRDLLSNGAQIADTVGGLDTKVGSVIGNLNQILAALADRNHDLSSTITNLKNLGGALAARKGSLASLVDDVTQMNSQLDALLTRNEGNIDDTVANLQTIVNVLAQHHDDLDTALSTLPAGTLPYFQISSYGQWFQFRSIFTCAAGDSPGGLANNLPQAGCMPANELSAPLGGTINGSSPTSGGSGASNGSLASVLGAVAGGGS